MNPGELNGGDNLRRKSNREVSKFTYENEDQMLDSPLEETGTLEDYEEQYEESDSDEGFGEVEDADWEMARGDFTKMFNRSRQLAQVIGKNSSGEASKQTSNVPLPAMNKGKMLRKGPTKGIKVQASISNDHPEQASSTPQESSNVPTDKTEEQLSQLQGRFASKMRIENAFDPSATAGGALSSNVPRKGNAGVGEKRIRDKSDRSTIQQVLDPRTMLILFKMLQRGFLKQVNGVISTGKEANVYHGSTYKYETTNEMIVSGQAEDEEEGIPLALKIYKTTILVFKDRDRYITGEFRFRHGYARHNPRKMVKLWAEKEARNLKRLVSAGIRCPRPVELRDHVLVMEFLEDSSGRNSPRLRDAEQLIDARRDAGEEDIWRDLYAELVATMRTMFHCCHLVHADLSEYNILYHREHLYIIDVSQSVEHDHPYAFDFLRADITHVDDYFSKRGNVQTLGLRKTFEWIVQPPKRPAENTSVRENDEDDREDVSDAGRRLNTLTSLASGPFSTFEKGSRGEGETDEELILEVKRLCAQRHSDAVSQQHDKTDDSQWKANDEEVFRNAYIPQTLNEVYDPERDIDVRNEGKGDDLIYANVIGVDERNESVSDEDSSASETPQGAKDKTPRGHKYEDKDAKKDRKKQVKEAARERRKTKMPKAEKKKRMRASHK